MAIDCDGSSCGRLATTAAGRTRHEPPSAALRPGSVPLRSADAGSCPKVDPSTLTSQKRHSARVDASASTSQTTPQVRLAMRATIAGQGRTDDGFTHGARQTAPAQASHRFGCPCPLVDSYAVHVVHRHRPPCVGEGSHPARQIIAECKCPLVAIFRPS